MPNLGDIEDKRPFVILMADGIRAMNALFDAVVDTLPGVIRAKHGETGAFGSVREVALVTGNYVRDGATSAAATKYTMQKQCADNALLPAEILISAVGDITVTFVSALPETTYDVQLTGALDDDGHPGSIAYDSGAKTASAVDVFMYNAAGVAHSLKGFSITLHYGA